MKNTLQTLALAGTLALGLTGCTEDKSVYKTFHEDAYVVKKEHIDARRYVDAILTGKTARTIAHTNSEVNLIKFEGGLDFTIDNKEIYDRFNLGDKAEVSFLKRYTPSLDNETNLVADEYYASFVDAVPMK